jgi:hypothetical protein
MSGCLRLVPSPRHESHDSAYMSPLGVMVSESASVLCPNLVADLTAANPILQIRDALSLSPISWLLIHFLRTGPSHPRGRLIPNSRFVTKVSNAVYLVSSISLDSRPQALPRADTAAMGEMQSAPSP